MGIFCCRMRVVGEQLALVVDHTAGTFAGSTPLAEQNIQQLASARRRFANKREIRHVPLVGTTDFKHLRRQGRELATRFRHFIEGCALFSGK